MQMLFKPGMAALHHSRMLAYRMPQGAIKTGESLFLAIDADKRFVSATLRLWNHGKEHLLDMQEERGPLGRRFHCKLTAPTEVGLVWYYFILRKADGSVEYYGGESGEGYIANSDPRGYQITVYYADFETPEWFRKSVMYQIFPDRFFRKGNPKKGIAYHEKRGRKMRFHENWDEEVCFLPEENEPYYEPNDFFGGTLKGITQQLPYLEEMGVGCLYINPIYEANSNHRYDAGDYLKVDPILGNNRDLKMLARKAKKHGIRLMLDGVFSHTGDDSLYFNKYGRYKPLGAYQSEKSPYRAWYDFGEYGDVGYRSWWGFPKHPEVEELNESYQEFVYGEKKSIAVRYAKLGVTSWRLDVADELPDEFIGRLRSRLKRIEGDSVVLGEVWEDASTKEAYGKRREYVLGKTLDSVMNYPFKEAVFDFLLGHIDAHVFSHRLWILRERYPKPFYYACMNLLSTHDSVRAITALAGAPHRDSLNREQQAHFKLTDEALVVGKKRFIMATAISMAIPGVPSIYYGDEVGMTGMADPFNRRTFPWGREDEALRRAIKATARERKNNVALYNGYCKMGAINEHVFAILRFTDGEDAFSQPSKEACVLTLVNRHIEDTMVEIHNSSILEGEDGMKDVRFSGTWRDVIGGEVINNEDEKLRIRLAPQSALMLIRDNI